MCILVLIRDARCAVPVSAVHVLVVVDFGASVGVVSLRATVVWFVCGEIGVGVGVAMKWCGSDLFVVPANLTATILCLRANGISSPRGRQDSKHKINQSTRAARSCICDVNS